MMMTLKENTANSMSQSIDYNTNGNNRSHSNIGYDYHHRHNPWQKSIPTTFDYQPTPYSFGSMSSTGDISSIESANKFNNSYFSYDITSNQNFYRRHTESTLPISNSIFSTSITTNHPSSHPFNYSHTTASHYHPSELFFGWNNGPSLMRTHSSASYQDYSQSTSFPCYNPINSSQSPINSKSSDSLSSTRAQTDSINTLRTNNYPSFFDIIPPIDVPLMSTQSLISSSSISRSKHSNPSIKKRPRLTAQLRNEILKLKSQQPTVFAWEIQQILLQNGLCTAQTLPSAKVIQRVLCESKKSSRINREETRSNINLVMETLIDNIENKSSPITICLSPSQSSTLSEGESTSECSICLETYRSGQEVSILSCSHEYHSSCIKEWMMKNRSCPMCRKDIHNQPQFVTLLI